MHVHDAMIEIPNYFNIFDNQPTSQTKDFVNNLKKTVSILEAIEVQ